MHQRVRSADNDTCFNVNEAWGSKIGAEKKQGNKDNFVMRLDINSIPPLSVFVLC